MKPVTILVIDDDYDIRHAVEQCLVETDIKPTVLTARNALIGLQLAKDHIPDVVVLDLQMPMGSGFDFVTELKRDPKLAQVKILILTANPTKSNIWQSIDKDVDDFLAKPFDVTELEARVKSLISKEKAGSGTI
jgi:DNA-binding response OmpR family regulator